MAEKVNNYEIIVNDGIIPVEIKNLHGDKIGVFYFNPSDIGIVERYQKLAGNFEYITEPMKDEAPEGMSEDDQLQFDIDKMNEAKERLFAACNELFGGDFAEAFFGKINPWSPSNGVFYCEEALNKVGQFIGKQFDAELDKINARIQQYTNRSQRRAAARKKK